MKGIGLLYRPVIFHCVISSFFRVDMIEARIDRRCSALRPVDDAISGISRRRGNFLSLCNALQMTIAGIKKKRDS